MKNFIFVTVREDLNTTHDELRIISKANIVFSYCETDVLIQT